jgi:hypothetical protein
VRRFADARNARYTTSPKGGFILSIVVILRNLRRGEMD